jgi:hypothetical protein
MVFLAKRGFGQASPEPATLPETLKAWMEGPGANRLSPGRVLWWGRSEALGSIPGLPLPEPTW